MTLSSRNYIRLMNDVRVRVPGALDDMIRRELFATMDEFFKASNAWRSEIAFTAVGEQRVYELDVDEHAQIVRLMMVTPARVAGDNYPWPSRTLLALMLDTTRLELYRTPEAGAALVAHVALTVRDPVNEDDEPVAPEWIIEKYRLQIGDGVTGRLMAQPAKPYTNAVLAKYHLQRFRQGIADARGEVDAGNVYDAQRWRFPYFANGRR